MPILSLIADSRSCLDRLATAGTADSVANEEPGTMI